MSSKQGLAWLLQLFPPATLALRWAVSVRAPRQRVGVLALIRDPQRRVLVARHTFRPWNPWGLPGGWLEHGEDPEEALRRELGEEFGPGLRITVLGLLAAGQHGFRGEPDGLSLIYECSLEGQIPDRLPLEILSVHWFQEAKARRMLRPLELRALSDR